MCVCVCVCVCVGGGGGLLLRLRARLSIFKNWFMLSVRISSCGCTREVWKAREKRKSSNPNFLSALQTSQVHP